MHLAVVGVALATVLSQVVSMCLILVTLAYALVLGVVIFTGESD